MSRTHNVIIPPIEFSRMESDVDHLTQIVNDRLRQIRRLEREIEAWREVAGQLATAAEHAGRPYHPSAWHTDQRCAALESYARLKTGTAAPYEL